MSDLIDVLKFVFEKVSSWLQSERQQAVRAYHAVVETSFCKLEHIHKNYTDNLSALRENLREKTLPPLELIQWLRDQGLQFRMDREFLWTIDGEIRSALGASVDPSLSRTDEFLSHAKRYIAAIVSYHEGVSDYTGLSFYRDFEGRLTGLLNSLDRPGMSESTQAKLFYATDYIQDTCVELLEIVDRRLPSLWRNVCIEYRSLRRLAGYPDA